MDNKKTTIEEPFRMYRGVGKCYSRGLSMLTDNFRSFLRFLFPVAAACALLSTLVNAAQLFPYELSLGFLEPYKDFMSVSFLIINIVVYCFFLSHVYTLIKMKASDHELSSLSPRFFYSESGKNFKRILGWYSIVLPLLFLVILLSGISGFFLLMLPLAYIVLMLVLPCLMLSGKHFWRGVQAGLKLGLRNLFHNLQMAVFLAFSVGLVCILVNSPLVSFYLMEFSAETSIASGDTVTLPTYYYCLAPAALFVTTFITLFFSIAFHTPTVYLYISAQTSYEEELASIGKH